MNAVQETREPSARFLVEVQPALVRQFESLAKAPGGMARLRDLILTLAVQGKLVKQDPSAESADRLLARVHAAKRELLAMGRIGKQKPTESIDDDETPFALPQGWAWCRVGDLAWPQAGFAFKSTGFNEVGQGLPLIRIRDVGSTEEPTTFFSGEFRPEFVVEKGDWLISMDGEFRVRRWHAATALLNQRVTRLVFIVDELHADFIATALQRELTALQGTKAYTTVDHLSGKQIAEAVIALPPSTEQARIVSRVDELMQLCDALEAKGRLEAQQHARLLETLLGTLTESTTPEELAANWQRVAEHFDLLLDRPEAVDVLEQTVLQLAVRGLLVSQDANEEPASELLARIETDRSRLIAEGKVASRAFSGTSSQIIVPFDVPPSWKWVAFFEYIHELCTGPFGSVIHKEDYVQEGVPLINPSHMVDGVIRHDPGVTIPPDLANRLGAYRLSAGDVLMARRGEVGRYALVTEREAGWLCGTGSFFVRLASFCNRDYFGLMLEDPVLRAHLQGASVGATMTNLNQRILLQSPIAVPPLNEQARIVARVTELRRFCAELRQRLASSQTTQSHLAEALVDAATA